MAFVLGAISLASGQPASLPNSNDHLIVPGLGIGQAHLGMSIGAAADAWGAPRGTLTKGQLTTYYWFDIAVLNTETSQYGAGKGTPAGGVFAWAVASGEIGLLGVVYDDRYQTAEGLRVGSSERDVEKALGTPTKILAQKTTHGLQYLSSNKGIIFWIEDRPEDTTYYRRVWRIDVVDFTL